MKKGYMEIHNPKEFIEELEHKMWVENNFELKKCNDPNCEYCNPTPLKPTNPKIWKTKRIKL